MSQMNGTYRVRDEKLKALFVVADDLASKCGVVDFTAYRRTHPEIVLVDQALNKLLDELEASGTAL